MTLIRVRCLCACVRARAWWMEKGVHYKLQLNQNCCCCSFFSSVCACAYISCMASDFWLFFASFSIIIPFTCYNSSGILIDHLLYTKRGKSYGKDKTHEDNIDGGFVSYVVFFSFLLTSKSNYHEMPGQRWYSNGTSGDGTQLAIAHFDHEKLSRKIDSHKNYELQPIRRELTFWANILCMRQRLCYMQLFVFWRKIQFLTELTQKWKLEKQLLSHSS